VSTISERVARGATWLDEKLPDWWKTLDVDPGMFDMSVGCTCVIGQLYPTVEDFDEDDTDESAFNIAVETAWLDLDWTIAVSHGFYAGQPFANWEAEYAALTAEWVRVITERRAAA
jgi:hypothetical protein